MKKFRIIALLLFIGILIQSVSAATPEENAAFEALDNWATTMSQYLAATPSMPGKSTPYGKGPIPGATELIDVVKNGPGLVCGISIVMVTNARLGLVLRYNEASDAGNYEDVEKLADLMKKIDILHSRLSVACENYFFGKDTPAGKAKAEAEEKGEEEDINLDDLNIVLKRVNGVEGELDDYEKRVDEYLKSYSLGDSYLLRPFKLNCSEIDTFIKEMNPYIVFLTKKRKELDSSIYAAYNLKIGSTGRLAVYKLVDRLDKELYDILFLIEFLRVKRKELDCGEVEISCNIEEFVERREEFTIPDSVPSYVYQNFLNSKVNIHCGMWKIVKISTTIDPKGGSTTDVEVDKKSAHVYGIRLDEKGKLSSDIIDGGWEDPDFNIYLTPDELEKIYKAKDPLAAFLEAWGKTIKFEGTATRTRVKAGALNLANNIRNKIQSSITPDKPAPKLSWQMPALPNPKLPSASTLGALPLQLGKFALNKIGILPKPQPKPEASCDIRGIPYNCYRGTLSLSPKSVNRGGTVNVKSNGFSFSGSVTLLLESVSGARTMLRVKGKTVNSNTYEFNANIPSGQYKVSAIVEKGAIDDFADSKDTLTVSYTAPRNVPGKLGESCDNRKCASGLVCGAPYTYGASGMRQAPGYGYTCISTSQFNTLCVGRGNSPPPWHCIT